MSKISSYSLTLLACSITLTLFSNELEQPPAEIYQDDIQHYRVSIRHIEGGGVGYSQGYTTLAGFFAPDPQQLFLTPFLDMRGHVFDNGRFAANTGLGIRALADCRLYGVNVYYDYRNTKHQHYHQIAAGLESLGSRWDFRVNGYLPVGAKLSSKYDKTVHITDGTFDSFSENYLLVRQTETKRWEKEYAMKGLDAEAAFHFLKNTNVDLYAATGPYYYNYKNKQVIGGQARIGAQIYEYLSIELINSYDSRFHEHFQGQIGLNIPFGSRKENQKLKSCQDVSLLSQRLVQDVKRQEIIVVDRFKKTKATDLVSIAIDPQTGNPYFFVFVNNTSSSLGTFSSPYPTFALAEANSSPRNILYVFPGDGTTKGMDRGIALKANQKLWGSGTSHSIQTTEGMISIPAQSSTYPTITNTDINTDGNAITLATNNAISGLIITSALNDAIYGTDPQSLSVSFCTIENTSTYAIEASFSSNASISLTNNQFVNNVNGVILTLDGPSTVVCSNNTFEGQTSISSIPLEIAANNNVLTARIENNLFHDNTTGSIRFDLDSVVNANITLLNNTITNNGTGSQASLGSSFVVIPNGTTDNCSIVLSGNRFSGNTSNSLYMHTSGAFTTLAVTASTNTMSNNGGSALVFATPVHTLTLRATDNIITGCNDNGIAIISSVPSSSGNITINNNTITNIGNASNAIAVNQDFSTLNLTILNNEINGCEGTGIISYAPTGIDSLILNISGNTISNCQNLSSNAAAGLDIEQYTSLAASVTNNTLSDNTGTAVVIGSTLSSPTACLTLTGNNNSSSYLLTNPFDGLFNLSPCDVDTANVGTINTSGTITPVQSCSDPTPCPP